MPIPLDVASVDAFVGALHESRKPVAFLVGAPLSAPDARGLGGVPDVAGFVKLVRAELEAVGPGAVAELEQKAARDPAAAYQAAMTVLLHWRNQDAVNRVIRRAVRCARAPSPGEAARTDEDVEADLTGWSTPAGTRDLAMLLASDPVRWAGPVLTTNFDPLLSVALRKLGRGVLQVVLDGDGALDQARLAGGGAYYIAHLHGYWLGNATLHTPGQLAGNRPRLKASLRRLLENRTLAVVAYGGWDDVFTRALADVVADDAAALDVLWAFYENDEAAIQGRYPRLLELTEPARTRGRIRLYGGIDCHRVLARLREPARAAHPNPKRAPYHLVVGESGVSTPGAEVALVGGMLVQDPAVLERSVGELKGDLLNAPHILPAERTRSGATASPASPPKTRGSASWSSCPSLTSTCMRSTSPSRAPGRT